LLPSLDPVLTFLLVKMLVAAVIVVTASLVAERTGALIAAMVATLPVSAGPIYFFLAMEHDSAFIGTAALGSIGASFATAAFSLAYVFAAQKFGAAGSLLIAYLAWAPVILFFRYEGFSFAVTVLFILALFPAAHVFARPYLAAKPAMAPKLAWYAIPVRALFVAMLVAAVTTLSIRIGAEWSGFFATFPVVLTSLVIFLHPRIGGPATAAIMASGILGLMGFTVALATVHLLANPIGKWLALAVGLAICFIWNLALIAWARR
jgi:hypothetical protein